MGFFLKLRGVMEQLFHINGPTGPQLKDSSGVIELKNFDDTDWAKGRAAHSAGGSGASDLHDVMTLLMQRSRVALIEFSFDGADVGGTINPGDNTNKFGFCHTSGGGYTQDRIYFDDGAAFVLLPQDIASALMTTDAITGDTSMIQDGLYAWEPDAAAWVLKGDVVGAGTGMVQSIEVSYAWNSPGGTVVSTKTIPAGARVLRCFNRVDTQFDGAAPTIAVIVDGAVSDQTIMATADSNVKQANTYLVEDVVEIDANETGPVRVNVTPSTATQGAGKVVVEFTTPFA